jgi:hypothetical protein
MLDPCDPFLVYVCYNFVSLMIFVTFLRQEVKRHTVIRCVSISAKFVICTVVGLNGTIVEAKIHTRDT